jgi:hypothetical protein
LLVVDRAGIEEVRQRARDFTKALRAAGAGDVADGVERHVSGFVDVTTVRRSVEAIRQQLRHFRAYPEELPEQPVVHIAANRLEDACKAVLRGEVIAPARMSLRAQGKRKLRLVTLTLSCAALLLGVPLALAMSGVDFTDLQKERLLAPVDLPKASVKVVHVNVLEESSDPAHTAGVELFVAGRCPARLANGMSCRDSGERSFGSRKLPAYEVMLPDEAYGIQVAFTDMRLLGAVGVGKVMVTALPETPEGEYVVPLGAAFVGYSPESCSVLMQVMSRCTPAARGPRALHERLAPALRVRVTKEVVRSREDVLAEQRLEQQRAIAERVQNITATLGAVREALDDAERHIKKKHFEPARACLDELAKLFEPLDALVVATADDEGLPEDVLHLRARFERSVQQQAHFEERAFETVYAALSKARGAASVDEKVFARVASQLKVTVPFLERVYSEHAEQIEQRIERAHDAEKLAEQKAHEALLRRCGPLPKTSFQEVRAFLTARARHVGSRLEMHECLTPRLSPETCWSVVCNFDEIRSVHGSLDDEVHRLSWTFQLRYGRVFHHREDARALP